MAMPEKALWWPAESTLLVADIHLGKDASFQAAGIPIPLGPTSETLQRLTDLIRKVRPRRVTMLGDLWHAKAGRTRGLLAEFVTWREDHCGVEMLLVEGNHDAKAGPLPASADMIEVQEPHFVLPFALCHYPCASAGAYVLSGHIHPGVVLEGRGRQALRLPCFWFGADTAVLPSFGLFTGCGRIQPRAQDQVLIIADDRVVPAQMSA